MRKRRSVTDIIISALLILASISLAIASASLFSSMVSKGYTAEYAEEELLRSTEVKIRIVGYDGNLIKIESNVPIDWRDLSIILDSKKEELLCFAHPEDSKKYYFDCYIQDCIKPGSHKLFLFYGGELKESLGMYVDRYLCIFPTVDYIQKRIVGFAKYNTGERYSGPLYYELDGGLAGKGIEYAVNGYFEILLQDLNFTYLLPKESWVIRWTDRKPLDFVDEPSSMVCYEDGCSETERISTNFAPYIRSDYIRDPSYLYTNFYMDIIEVTKDYIKVNYTIELNVEQNISASGDRLAMLLEVERGDVEVLGCGGANCFYGRPYLNISLDIAGKILNVDDDDTIYLNFSIRNTGSGAALHAWCCCPYAPHWRVCLEAKDAEPGDAWNMRDCAKLYNLYWIGTPCLSGCGKRLIEPGQSFNIVLYQHVSTLKQWLERNGISSYNGTWATYLDMCTYGYPNFQYKARFALNKPTANYTVVTLSYPSISTVEYDFGRNLTQGKYILWAVLKIPRQNYDYRLRIQLTPVVDVRSDGTVIKGYFYRVVLRPPGYYIGGGGDDYVTIPGRDKKLSCWLFPKIIGYNKEEGYIDIEYNLIMFNSGGNVIENVTVYKKMGRNLRATCGNCTFDFTPPEEWNIEFVGVWSCKQVKDPNVDPWIVFNMTGYRWEILNCSSDGVNKKCDISGWWGGYWTGPACNASDGRCYWACRWEGTRWHCALYSWATYRNITDYYLNTGSTVLNIFFNSTWGGTGFTFRADFYTTESLWTNHQEHILIISAEGRWYAFRFTA